MNNVHLDTGSCAPCYSHIEDGSLLNGLCVQPTTGTATFLFMSLIELIIKSQCSIADPCHRFPAPLLNPNYYNVDEVDFIVVGGGPAGAVVASRLSENSSHRVLLLEAGPEEPTITSVPVFAFGANETDYDWKFKTTPQKKACQSTGGVCRWPRGKMLCGTACLSGLMYSRGSPAVYDQWGATNPGWKFKHLFPYFLKSESNVEPMDKIEKDYHGFQGPLYVDRLPSVPDFGYDILDAARELDYSVHDINGRSQEGFTIAPVMSKDGLLISPSKAFLRPAKTRTNLRILLRATAVKILFNESKTRATGIQYLDKWGKMHTVHALKEIVISGGVVGSPQLLMLSGIGPKDRLEKLGINVVRDLPVGGNLHYHIGSAVRVHVSKPNTNSLTLDSLRQYIDERNGPFSSNGLTQVTAFVTSKYESLRNVPDVQLFVDGYVGACQDDKAHRENSLVTFRPVFLRSHCRGSITLQSNNPSDAPLIDPNYLCDEKDADVLLEAVKLIRNLTETKALAKYVVEWNVAEYKNCDQFRADDDRYWRCVFSEYTDGENHHGGTCKMGPKNDPMAVVNHELKVHGFSNLRVADAAIFPTPVNCNPIAPIVMVGEKVADMINSVWN